MGFRVSGGSDGVLGHLAAIHLTLQNSAFVIGSRIAALLGKGVSLSGDQTGSDHHTVMN
tara:strand:+ start:2040 stop:2216 length:177 start_codon:yes stop_codon:yes gene_type:complete